MIDILDIAEEHMQLRQEKAEAKRKQIQLDQNHRQIEQLHIERGARRNHHDKERRQ